MLVGGQEKVKGRQGQGIKDGIMGHLVASEMSPIVSNSDTGIFLENFL